MFYAKACIKPSLEVVEIETINFQIWMIAYIKYQVIERALFEDIVWLDCNSRPIIK